jgi:ubiquinone/menaquinone biosynthesis C-methylase UbiE
MDEAVRQRMRADWNARAREDAHYYVAFGRRDQDDGEFLSTAVDVIRDLEGELKRFPQKPQRALEIGCGPGRLMRPMSRHFGEIHGVDVSDEMIAQAKQKLRDIPWAHTHAASGSDLAQFPDNHFDFVYSYAVFQHIPSAEVVFSYLRETVRVLKPGGFARLQINGLPKSAKAYTTWEGVRISADEVHQFTREHGIRLLSLTGVETQYMWTSWQKPPLREAPASTGRTRIRHVVNAFSGEQAVPSTGRLACATLQIEALPAACDLNSLTASIDGVPGTPCYVGPPVNALSQFNVFLPPGVRTGLVPVSVTWRGEPLCPDATIRVIPAGPSVPRLVAISDGVNLMSPQRVESGTMKATIEEVEDINTFQATINGAPVREVETFRTDPLCSRYEVNFKLPAGTQTGGYVLDVSLGNRLLTRMGIEVA